MIKCLKDLPTEVFQKILCKGFYYIKGDSIYWESNAVFIGNGYHDCMVRTHFLDFEHDGDRILKDAHYWDWAEKEDIFDFCTYGKTWCVDRVVLEGILSDCKTGNEIC